MKFRNFLEGYNERGKQDGTGPYKGSAMANSGNVGPRARFKRGGCPKREDFKDDASFEEAMKKYKEKIK